MVNATAARTSCESQALPRDVRVQAATLERAGKGWSHKSHRVPRLGTGNEAEKILIHTSHSQCSKEAEGLSGQDWGQVPQEVGTGQEPTV